MKNLCIILLGLFICLGPGLMAQKATPFADKTANPEKISVKFDFPAEGRTSKKGSGYSANVDLLDPKPKKVALVSFYLYDPASGKASKTTTSTHIYSSASVSTTSEAVGQTQIDGFYAQSIEPLIAGFKEFGIDLLTPEEFLDTEEKKDFFYGFNQESGKKEKTERTQIGAYVQATGGTLKICPYEEGYRPFFVVNEPLSNSMVANFVNTGIGGANRKMTSSLGYDLANALEVDAVVVCVIVTRKPSMKKEDYNVDAVSLYMIGPNPMSDGPEDKNRGQFYCGTRFFAKQLEFANAKSGVTSYDNMGNVMTALAKKNANWVINRAKK
ncbi:MAG: hypothetical protein K8S16_04085 [Bacteroidales bacterium]|nr:hypothetical protein [Bacteroidales bacterium]